VEGFGARTWVVPSSANGPLSTFVVFPASVAADVVTSDGSAAAPIVVQRNALRLPHGVLDTMVFGSDRLGAFGAPPVNEGRAPSAPGDAVVDAKGGIALGETFPLGGRTFRAVGLVHARTLYGGLPTIYISLADAQSIAFNGRALATDVLVRGGVTRVPSGFKAMSVDAARLDALRPLQKATAAVDTIKYLLWVVAACIIGAIVYLSAIERTRDFAVFRAAGCAPRALYAGLAFQAVVVSLASAALSTLIAIPMAPLFPMPVSLPLAGLLLLPVIAVAVGMLASVSGLRRALAADPALAFGGPG